MNECLTKAELNVVENDSFINVFDNDRCIRISQKHKIYLPDVLRLFDFYFFSVEYKEMNGYKLVDFSTPKSHKVKGYDLHEVMFSSFTEPIHTTLQYINFANLNEDSVVIDLGAYSGLTSILFDMDISKNNKNAKGRVIAVDADLYNTECIENNLKLYEEKTGRKIEYLHGAAWGKDGEVDFSNEANMGASVTCVVGNDRGLVSKVKAYSLSTIAKKYNLPKVDFIKCDIEGGEISVFDDEDFFRQNTPRIIVESHLVENFTKLSTEIFVSKLIKYGYMYREIKQDGFDLPLVLFYPAINSRETFWQLNERISETDKKIEKNTELLYEIMKRVDDIGQEVLGKLNKPTLLQRIFSIRNESKHKIVRILGLKIKIKRKNK